MCCVFVFVCVYHKHCVNVGFALVSGSGVKARNIWIVIDAVYCDLLM
jgi:hypothetical protein